MQLCKHEAIDQIIFIGLNYGADIGIEIAKISPTFISHLILLEPPIFMEPWIVKVVEQHIKDLADLHEVMAQETVETVIMKAQDYERKIALKALKRTNSYVKAFAYKHLLN